MIPEQIGLLEVPLPTLQFPRKKQMHSCFCERAFNTNYPNFEKISLAETLSNVTNAPNLENPQFGLINFVIGGLPLSTPDMIG